MKIFLQFIFILIGLCSFLVHGQSLYFGPVLEGGSLKSTSTHVRPDVNPGGYLTRTGFTPQFGGGAVLGMLLKNNDFSVSLAYRAQALNHIDPNARYFTNGESQYVYKAKLSGVSSQLKYLRAVHLNEEISLMGGMGLQLSFFKNQTTTDDIEATGYDKNTLYFEHALSVKSLGLGLSPELGLRYKLSAKTYMYVFGKYNIGLSDYAEGSVNRVVLNSTRVEQGAYASKGTGTMLGLRLQYHIVKNPAAVKERLLAKEQKKKEKAQRDSLANALETQAKTAKEQALKDSIAKATETTEKVVQYDSLGIPKTLDNRVIDKQNEVTVSSLEIELYVWDDKQEDGDSISLYLNGAWILEKFRIQTKKKSIKITLDPNRDNYLIMYALNEGRMPPNTCAVSLNDGTGERRLNLKSTMKSCAALHFKVKNK